jgi:hypothetical protein
MARCVRCCCCLLVLLLVALGVTAVVVFLRHRNGGGPVVPGGIDRKYAEALAVALQFFQVQKCTHARAHFTALINLCDSGGI